MSIYRVARDPQLSARITRRTPLMYRAGADPTIDRPAHVRAGSALAWIGDRLIVVQDDANFIALASPFDAQADSVMLPGGHAGARQFDDERGNKAYKLDLESCITLVRGDVTTLVAFGSGSTAARERLAIVDFMDATPTRTRIVAATDLYAALRATTEFAGSQLNIEGAVLTVDGHLTLFGRGNGAVRGDQRPVNASCTLDGPALWAHVGDPSAHPPRPHSVRRYELGAIDGIPLGFTDAIRWGEGTMFSAAAEASPDAIRDGRVTGSVLGILPEAGDPRCTVVADENGAPFRGKIEGLAVGRHPAALYAVADEDDSTRPSMLCVIDLDGW